MLFLLPEFVEGDLILHIFVLLLSSTLMTMVDALINFVIYSVGISWQWRHLPLELIIPKKLGNAFARVYVGASLFKLVRIFAAIALAPPAGRILKATQKKLGVSENTAFTIWIILLLKTFFATVAVSIVSDSALRKTMSVNP